MWLAEIKRILKKDGFAYLTLHSEHTWSGINAQSWLYRTLFSLKDVIKDYTISLDLFSQPMPAPKTVFHWDTAFVYKTHVFHSRNYIYDAWGRYLRIKDWWVGGHNVQDVVLLQK